MPHSICVTCGTQFPVSDAPPAHCPICEDDRQYINPKGQQWTTLEAMRGNFRNTFTDVEPGVIAIRTDPTFAIAQQAYLIQSDTGNILWDCITFLDDDTIAEVKKRGGIAAIGISHPHFYSTMVEWSRAFNAPIHLHEDNQPWVMRPDEQIHYWHGETFEPLPGFKLVRCGGHFPGSTVLHWPAGAGGNGVLLTGDTIFTVADPRWVTFMYSYPNLIPLNARAVRDIARAVDPLRFDRLYSSWPGKVIDGQARDVVRRSAGRYIAHIEG